jgi:hypothetical protein
MICSSTASPTCSRTSDALVKHCRNDCKMLEESLFNRSFEKFEAVIKDIFSARSDFNHCDSDTVQIDLH